MVKVSIVIPVCNVEKYIGAGLDSILAQTLEEIEVICVDDCSSDSSAEILRQYAQKDKRIKCVFHETNLGTSQARKDGVKLTTGKYVMFLDGDDQLTSDACEKAFQAIEEHQVDMVQFDTEVVNCAGMPKARIESNQKALRPCMERIEAENLLGVCWREKRFGYTLWNKIYNGEICRRAFDCVENGYFPKAQDLYAFFIIAYFSKSYMGIEGRFYRYNFGLGVTGGDMITIKKYDILLTEKRVGEAVERFVAARGKENELGDIVSGIRHHFLEECVNRWKNNLEPECKSEGFDHLTEVWGFEDVLMILTEKSWFDRARVSEKMRDIDYFQYRKRPAGKKKTIAAYYRCINNGGAQRVVAMLCNKWAKLKDENGEYLYNVVLITDEEKQDTDYYVNQRVQRVYISNYLTASREKYRARYRDWQQIITKYEIDVVVSSMWMAPCTLWDLLSVKGHESKPAFIIHSHSFCCMPFRNSGSAPLEVVNNYQLCDGVVCLSECDERFASAFNRHTKFILNPITFEKDDFKDFQCEKNAIVWVGRISAEKNPKEAVEMMRYVVREIPDAKLYLVGAGDKDLYQSTMDLIERTGLQDHVIMTGFSENVGEYYQKAAVYICTSEYEGFPLTYCEATAHAVPIVSYNLPWLTFMQDGRGIISVPERRFDIMAKEVISLLKNPERCQELGEEGQEQLKELSSVDISKQWKKFFDYLDEEHEEGKKKDSIEDIIFQYMTKYQEIGKTNARAMVRKEGEQKLRESQKKYRKLEKKLKNLENSTTFKVGKAIMCLPIGAKKAVKRLIKGESTK